MIHRLLTLAAAAILAGTTPALAQPPPPARPMPAVPTKAPEAVVTLENGGEIRIELFPADAPRHVDNFVKLASRGFYDGQRFHRVVPNFVVQIGCPKGNGSGGPGYNVPAEFNAQKHVRGTVAMARSQHPDSAGSQFYICYGPTPHLDGNYTVFGHVVAGMEHVDRIQQGDRMASVGIVDA